VRPELDDTATPDKTATQSKQPAAPSTSSELAAGVRLGHFRIDRKLGAGGMGEVYLATDLALDRPVAVKVLPSGVASGSARERLIKEARAQARVHHPNVAHIYFIGEETGRLYFAMEYVTGKTLADRIADGPLPVEEALGVLRATVLGLREAQRAGFTHRDVKPSNLMVDAHGVLKVLDFGLAAGNPEGVTDGPVAQTTLAGTPLYMAPEQARGEAIDFRADIYALGATLFHLVSGRPPFVADSVDQLITLHATAARPSVPRGANPRTTITAIDTLIAKMMAPDPRDRFASYDELLRAIELASVGHTHPAGILVRAIAGGIDLGLTVIVTGIIATIISTAGSFNVDIDNVVIGAALAYRALASARWGATLGKALFELEVVAIATSRRPTRLQAFRRELACGGGLLALDLGVYAAELAGLTVSAEAAAAFAVLIVVMSAVAFIHAALRVPGKRAPWDRFAGTMVRYRTSRGSAGAVP
jgi:hypothetical protein